MVGQTPEQTKLGDLMLAKAHGKPSYNRSPSRAKMLGDHELHVSRAALAAAAAVDGRSDLYSLGALMYALLTGRPPLEGKNLIETMTRIRLAEPIRPKLLQVAIPDRLEEMVLRLLAKLPDDRYASATALLKDLERWLAVSRVVL